MALALALGTVGAGASAAPAQVPPVVQRIEHALAAVHSYKIVSDTTTSGSGSARGATSAHLEMTVVRKGIAATMYMTITSKTAAGQVLRQEMAYTGTRFCERQSTGAAWQCSAPDPDQLSQFVALRPDMLLSASGVKLQPASIGRKVLLGQTCEAYTLTSTMMEPGSRSTLWVSSATSLPVEEEMLSTLSLGNAAAIRSTAVFGHWNDPSLKIPALPGS